MVFINAGETVFVQRENKIILLENEDTLITFRLFIAALDMDFRSGCPSFSCSLSLTSHHTEGDNRQLHHIRAQIRISHVFGPECVVLKRNSDVAQEESKNKTLELDSQSEASLASAAHG